MSADRVSVCGIPVDAVDQQKALALVAEAVDHREFLQVSTVNLQYLVNARRRHEVQATLNNAELNIADGAPIVWLARMRGGRLPGRVPGVDMLLGIAREAATTGARLFLLGGANGVAESAAAVLRARFPGLLITGTYEPPKTSLESVDSEAIISRISEAGADILVVGLGHPKQDLWIAANRDRLPVAVAIGIGGSFDIIAGRFRRAPEWAQRCGLEWLYRLVQEPRRLFARYATCAAWFFGVFVPIVLWHRLSGVPALVGPRSHALDPVVEVVGRHEPATNLNGSAKPSTTSTPRRRLEAVDGLRAIAALWVVLFHIRAFSGANLGPFDLIVRSGSTGVSLFLVLSGFCLYLPVLRKGSASFRPLQFLRRRAQRLLPAYYVSLVVIVLVTMLAAGHLAFPAYDWQALLFQVVTHVTMTFSLFSSTFYAFNGAYWSLGLEWQLYLSMPLLVLASRRYGLFRTVVAVVAINVAYRLGLQFAIDVHAINGTSPLATLVLPNLLPGRWAEFAFGMVAAHLYFSGKLQRWSRILGYALIPLVPFSLISVGDPLSHLVFGAVFFAVLCVVLTGHNLVSRVVAWRPLVSLGVMSYSLYLVHQPMVQAFAVFLREYGASPMVAFLEVLVLLPVVLLVARLLFVVIERRTIVPAADGSQRPGGPTHFGGNSGLRPHLIPKGAGSN
jgi:N-acetylglucosaminyldiphosphoundecaprenol N-acetyl-beta-D-mannosaminyltransferase